MVSPQPGSINTVQYAGSSTLREREQEIKRGKSENYNLVLLEIILEPLSIRMGLYTLAYRCLQCRPYSSYVRQHAIKRSLIGDVAQSSTSRANLSTLLAYQLVSNTRGA